jgi:hypothetical protein
MFPPILIAVGAAAAVAFILKDDEKPASENKESKTDETKLSDSGSGERDQRTSSPSDGEPNAEAANAVDAKQTPPQEEGNNDKEIDNVDEVPA